MNHATYRHELVTALLRQRLVAVVRSRSSDEAVTTARDLAGAGVHAIEVSLTTPRCLDAITALRDVPMLLGAGTVTDPYAARAVILAGARFLVSPSADPNVAAVARACGAPYVAGAQSPTEMERAVAMGADLVKIFPAGDAEKLHHLHTVYPHVPLVPTGGVRADDAPAFLAAGAAAVGMGSALTPASAAQILERLADVSA